MCSHADRPIPSADLVTAHRDAVPDLRREAVSIALAKSAKGGAADMWGGWMYEHLQLLTGNKSAMDSLTGLVNLVIKAQLSGNFVKAGGIGRFTPLSKKGDATRPLVCGL